MGVGVLHLSIKLHILSHVASDSFVYVYVRVMKLESNL